MVTVNGQMIDYADGLSLASYLVREGYILTGIAVEVNGEIVLKAKYDEKILSDGDVIEIVQFVGGG